MKRVVPRLQGGGMSRFFVCQERAFVVKYRIEGGLLTKYIDIHADKSDTLERGTISG